MKVYADVLIFTNILTDYFLLRLTDLILKRKAKLWRMVAASVLGGIFSLYIFFPQNPLFLEIIIKTIMCAVLTATCFSSFSFSCFARTFFLFTALTFSYGGFVIAIWNFFRPSGIIINNSVVYYNLSPVILILSSVLFYIIGVLVKKFFGKKFSLSKECKLTITNKDKTLDLLGILDSGNSITDPLGTGDVIIVNKYVNCKLFENAEDLTKFRLIPCKTVTGSALLKGYRADFAKATLDGKDYKFKNPIIITSPTAIPENSAILNPQIFDREVFF